MESIGAVGSKLGSLVGILGIFSLLFGCGSKDKAPGHEFSIADGVVHYRDATIEGADSGTFKPLDDHYAKDARQVYYASTYRVGQDYFTTKRARIRVVEGADGRSFRLLRDGYARDAQRVYFEGGPIEVEDVDTFELLDSGFARDRVRGYYMEEPVPGSDGATFVVLDSHYAKDAHHVFHCDLEPGADGLPPRRVTVPLPAANPASFVPLDNGYAKDASQAYYRGRVIAPDPDSFAVLYFRLREVLVSSVLPRRGRRRRRSSHVRRGRATLGRLRCPGRERDLLFRQTNAEIADLPTKGTAYTCCSSS